MTSADTPQVDLEALAAEILDNLKAIADLAHAGLRQRRASAGALASPASWNPDKAIQNLNAIQAVNEADCLRLVREPAVARLVIADEGDNREILYVSPAGTIAPLPFKFCSYFSPKGRLASISVGDERQIRLPGAEPTWFEVLEKATFVPRAEAEGQWDAIPTVLHGAPPQTIQSLRKLLQDKGARDSELDALERLLQEGDAGENVVAGLRRAALTAMQMRVQPVLDQFQDEIFRLPLDSRLAILGPPGSGKTTTLIKRLRQKVDLEHLTEDEREIVAQTLGQGPEHRHSWLMFTPTTLLKEYVKAAFAAEDIPVTEDRIQTWDDYRRSLARSTLPILSAGGRQGMVIRQDTGVLQPETLFRQIDWFEAFDAYQEAQFQDEILEAGRRMARSTKSEIARMGQRVVSAVERSRGRPAGLMVELSGLTSALQKLQAAGQAELAKRLQRPLANRVSGDPGFLGNLSRFVAGLSADPDEDLDDPDGEDEPGEAPAGDQRIAVATFVRALRARAIADAEGRQVAPAGRNGRLLAWLADQGVSFEGLKELGAESLVQRAMGQVIRAPALALDKIPARYRRFRREAFARGEWYASQPAASSIDPLELDLVILAMLRAAGRMSANSLLMTRLGDRAPGLIEGIAGRRRNQILVDEATDFSPLQLACMASLVNPETSSFLAIGDFNQRLTLWGLRTRAELEWLFRDIDVRTVDIVYRQSRRLNEFAVRLLGDAQAGDGPRMPEYMEHEGFSPVLGTGLADLGDLAHWLTERIREVEGHSGRVPSIAVLVNHEDQLKPLAEALNDVLVDYSLTATPCFQGQTIGSGSDIRIFDIQHIKGLEFEAIFFVGVDELAAEAPDLFDRYVYVGATRAATFLGLTCSGGALPEGLAPVVDLLRDDWRAVT